MISEGSGKMTDLIELDTEKNNQRTIDIDILSTQEILQKINDEDQTVASIVSKSVPQISALVDQIVDRMQKGGRLFYIGAGTSGRLGVLDAAECPPTYGVDKGLVVGIMAGGDNAMFIAQEGAEDSLELARGDLSQYQINENDTVIGLAASGRTPYVIGGLRYAREIGALTGAISCVQNAEISKFADYPIEAVTGAEAIMGSTRMKAGTAQKLILNMISTSVMIKLGKVYKNYMVDLKPTNKKLVVRSKNMIRTLTGVDDELAEKLYEESGHNVKKALIMEIMDVDRQTAEEALMKGNGHIKRAIQVLGGDI